MFDSIALLMWPIVMRDRLLCFEDKLKCLWWFGGCATADRRYLLLPVGGNMPIYCCYVLPLILTTLLTREPCCEEAS